MGESSQWALVCLGLNHDVIAGAWSLSRGRQEGVLWAERSTAWHPLWVVVKTLRTTSAWITEVTSSQFPSLCSPGISVTFCIGERWAEGFVVQNKPSAGLVVGKTSAWSQMTGKCGWGGCLLSEKKGIDAVIVPESRRQFLTALPCFSGLRLGPHQRLLMPALGTGSSTFS